MADPVQESHFSNGVVVKGAQRSCSVFGFDYIAQWVHRRLPRKFQCELNLFE